MLKVYLLESETFQRVVTAHKQRLFDVVTAAPPGYEEAVGRGPSWVQGVTRPKPQAATSLRVTPGTPDMTVKIFWKTSRVHADCVLAAEFWRVSGAMVGQQSTQTYPKEDNNGNTSTIVETRGDGNSSELASAEDHGRTLEAMVGLSFGWSEIMTLDEGAPITCS